MKDTFFHNKKILITQNALHFIAGSEIVTLELAKFFQSAGAKVTVFTWFLDEPMKSEFIKNKIYVTTDDFNKRAVNADYVWVHHQVIPVGLLQNLGQQKFSKDIPHFIFNHMSAINSLLLEQPFIPNLEKQLASLNAFVSQEALDLNSSKYPNTFNHSFLFPNPSPSAFQHPKNPSESLNHILIVSNHPPKELNSAAQILSSEGITVDHLGQKSNSYQVITPQILQKYDAVIAIGKTVQYCLNLNIPIYIYDHFGGCGYLTRDNYDKAAYANFSGRGFSKKSPTRITQEIINKYPKAQKFQTKNLTTFAEKFSLSKNITNLFKNLPPTPHKIQLSKEQLINFVAAETIAREKIIAENTAVNYSYIISEKENIIDAQKSTIQNLEQRVNELNAVLESFRNSRNVRIANTLHKAPHLIKDKAGKIIRNTKKHFNDKNYKIEQIAPHQHNSYPIIGLIREKNESLILDDTLNELEKIVDGFIVLDDNSNDNSINIAKRHPKCLAIIHHLKTVTGDRSMEESIHRQKLLDLARLYHPKWLFYQDADERIDDALGLQHFLKDNIDNSNIQGIRLSLFDAYMTQSDHRPYDSGPLLNFRKSFGPERRDILFAWKNIPEATFMSAPDMREPDGIEEPKVITKFFVQHYGKSISVEQWEETCDYYVNHFPQYAKKWQARKGKGIHSTMSDFNRPLITWGQAKQTGGIKIN